MKRNMSNHSTIRQEREIEYKISNTFLFSQFHTAAHPNIHPSLLRHTINSSNFLVQRQDSRNRSHGRDTKGVDLLVALGVVALDVCEIGRFAKSWVLPVQVSDPFVQSRISTSNIPEIGLEVLDVDRVEADDSRIQPNIRLRNLLPKIIRPRPLSQMLLRTIQRLKKRSNSLLVRLLRSREPTLINSVIDIIIRPLVSLFNLPLQFLRQKVQFLVFAFEQMVEFMIEHADDLTALIAYDFLLFFVVEGGNCEAAGVVGVAFEVYVPDVCEFRVEWVWGGVCSWQVLFVWCGESPAFFSHVPMNTGEGDEVFKTFQFADDESSVSPWAGVGDIEMVAVLLRWELCSSISRDEVAELRGLPFEFSRLVLGVNPVEDIFLIRR